MTPWTDERLRLYPRAILFALTVAFALSLVGSGAETATGRLGGDFPAFYGAGRIVREGDVDRLYDWDRQAAAEVGLFPADDPDGFLAFAYPPFVALAYAPLAGLPYRAAYAVHTIGMALAVAAMVRLLVPHLPRVGAYPMAAFVAVLTFHPLFRAVGGAQNTAISALLVVASAAAVAAGRDVLGGVAIGLLLFKPQLAVPFVGLYLVEGRWRVLAGAAAAGAGLYALGAAMAGPSWPLWWWREGVAPFQGHDQGVNAANCVGWLGFLEAIAGVGHPVAAVVGWSLALATVAGLVAVWFRAPERDRIERTALAAVGALMISPHAMFYDAGLLAPALLVAADRDARLVPLLAVLWAVAHAHPVKEWLGFTPLFFVCVAMLGVAAHVWSRARAA